jgi:ParB family chromosome partitioning protein
MAIAEAEYSGPNNTDLQQPTLPTGHLCPSGLNPRKHFDPEGLEELAASIRAHGVLEPLIVRPLPEDTWHVEPGHVDRMPAWFIFDMRRYRQGETYSPPPPHYPTPEEADAHLPRWEIIAGERRWRAATLAAVESVPVVVRVDLQGPEHDHTVLELMVAENLRRCDLNAIEEAQAYRHLAELGLKQTEIAARFGIAQPTVANALKLLQLPESVLELVATGALSKSHGQALTRFAPWPAVCEFLASEAVRRNLTSTELQESIPSWYELVAKGLAARLWNVDFRTTACTQCQDYRKVNEGIGLCFRPEHARELEAAEAEERGRRQEAAAAEAKAALEAARAQANAAVTAQRSSDENAALAAVQAQGVTDAPEPEADAAPEVPAVPSASALSMNTYAWLDCNNAPAACKREACPSFGLLLDNSGAARVACLDTQCYRKLLTQEQNEAKRAIAAVEDDRLERALAAFAGDLENPGRVLVPLLAIAAEATLSRERKAPVAQALSLIGSDLDARLFTEMGYEAYTTHGERFALLSRMDASQLIRLAAAAVLYGERHDFNEYNPSRATAWLAGDPEDAKELADSRRCAVRDAAFREAANAARAAAGLEEFAGPPAPAQAPAEGERVSVGTSDLDPNSVPICAHCGAFAGGDFGEGETLPNGVVQFEDDSIRTPAGLFFCPECADTVQVCRKCGCTEEAACPGGCAWVEDDLCSACAPASGDGEAVCVGCEIALEEGVRDALEALMDAEPQEAVRHESGAILTGDGAYYCAGCAHEVLAEEGE